MCRGAVILALFTLAVWARSPGDSETLATGIAWPEGPVWQNGALYFSSTVGDVIYRWKSLTGTQVFITNAGGPAPVQAPFELFEPGSNGLAIDPLDSKNLIVCQHRARRVILIERFADLPVGADLSSPEFESRVTVLADNYNGKRFNSPNDIAVHSNGDIFFSDPPFGLQEKNPNGLYRFPKNMKHNPLREIDSEDIYVIRRRRIGNRIEVVNIESLATIPSTDGYGPNGLAFSPDYSKLYVAISDTHQPFLYEFTVETDESKSVTGLKRNRLLFDFQLLGNRVPDGLKVHTPTGNIYVAGPKGVIVLDPEGDYIKTLPCNVTDYEGNADFPTLEVSNLAFDEDYENIYITATDRVIRMEIYTDTTKSDWSQALLIILFIATTFYFKGLFAGNDKSYQELTRTLSEEQKKIEEEVAKKKSESGKTE